MSEPSPIPSPALYAYGVLGVVAILSNAIVRLTPLAIEPLRTGTMGALQWAVAVPWLVMMIWTEGVQGFHRKFSPRVVARARHLDRAPLGVRLIAPLACMGLVWATRRRLIGSWALVMGIVVLVIGVQQLSQPWRGVVDLGVVAGLGTGTASLVWHAARALRGELPTIDPDLPEGVVPDAATA